MALKQRIYCRGGKMKRQQGGNIGRTLGSLIPIPGASIVTGMIGDLIDQGFNQEGPDPIQSQTIIKPVNPYINARPTPQLQDGGSLTQYQGASHEEGGIDLGIAEVEGGENEHNMVVNSDTKKLKLGDIKKYGRKYGGRVPIDKRHIGKTPAEVGEEIDRRYEKFYPLDHFNVSEKESLDALSEMSQDMADEVEIDGVPFLKSGGRWTPKKQGGGDIKGHEIPEVTVYGKGKYKLAQDRYKKEKIEYDSLLDQYNKDSQAYDDSLSLYNEVYGVAQDIVDAYVDPQKERVSENLKKWQGYKKNPPKNSKGKLEFSPKEIDQMIEYYQTTIGAQEEYFQKNWLDIISGENKTDNPLKLADWKHSTKTNRQSDFLRRNAEIFGNTIIEDPLSGADAARVYNMIGERKPTYWTGDSTVYAKRPVPEHKRIKPKEAVRFPAESSYFLPRYDKPKVEPQAPVPPTKTIYDDSYENLSVQGLWPSDVANARDRGESYEDVQIGYRDKFKQNPFTYGEAQQFPEEIQNKIGIPVVRDRINKQDGGSLPSVKNRYMKTSNGRIDLGGKMGSLRHSKYRKYAEGGKFGQMWTNMKANLGIGDNQYSPVDFGLGYGPQEPGYGVLAYNPVQPFHAQIPQTIPGVSVSPNQLEGPYPNSFTNSPYGDFSEMTANQALQGNKSQPVAGNNISSPVTQREILPPLSPIARKKGVAYPGYMSSAGAKKAGLLSRVEPLGIDSLLPGQQPVGGNGRNPSTAKLLPGNAKTQLAGANNAGVAEGNDPFGYEDLLGLAPIATNLLQYGMELGRDDETYEYPTIEMEDYQELDPTQEIARVESGFATAQEGLRRSGALTQAGAIQLATERGKGVGDVYSRYNNANIQGRNRHNLISQRGRMFNAGQRTRGMIDTAANKGAGLGRRSAYLSALGTQAGQLGRDINMMDAQDRWNLRMTDLLAQRFPHMYGDED